MNYNRSMRNIVNNTSSSNNNNNNNNKNFTRTCSRLSQFMKERRRSLGEQSCFAFPHMAPLPSPKPADPKRVEEEIGKKDGALSLFPDNKAKEGKISASHSVDPDENRKSVELLFQLTNPSTSQQSLKPTTTNVRALGTREEAKSTSASMTIFYGGKVVVFDEFPEDKAEEIISLATSQTTKKKTYPQTSMETQTQTQIEITTPGPSPMTEMKVMGTQHNKQDTVSQDHAGGPSDLPIARRTSLFRFIEKRKDRVASAAPYQQQNASRGADRIENSNAPPENSNRQRYNVVMRNLCQQQQEEQKQKQLLELRSLRQRKEEEQKQRELLELRKLCQRQEEELKKQKRLLELQQQEEELKKQNQLLELHRQEEDQKQKRLLAFHQQEEEQKQKRLLELNQREEEQKQKQLLELTNLCQQQEEDQKQKQLLELKL